MSASWICRFVDGLTPCESEFRLRKMLFATFIIFQKKKKNSTHSCKNLQKIKAIKRIEYCNIEWLSMALLDSERRLSWESVPNKRRLLNLPKMQSVLVSPKDSLAYLSRRDKPAQRVLSVMMRALKKTLRTFISWKNKWKKEIYKRSGGC